ncbi:MAG: nucleoside phosphorylase [bacterium]|nr:nucleoside phosphorylase [bacterium]MCP4968734.1 nucleoside phosphorylase [bacterium]
MPNRSEIVVTDEGRLYHLGIAPHEIAGSIFLVGDPDRAYRVAQRFSSVDYEARNREYVTLTGEYHGVAMSVVGTGIGTDNVEIAMIELDAAHGMDLATGLRRPGTEPLDIIRIGTSGGLQPDVAAGTLCNAEYALGLDSTGLYYETPADDGIVGDIEDEAQRLLGEAVGSTMRFSRRLPVYATRANSQVSAALTHHAEQAGVRFESGITVSSPGFYGPSSRYIDGLVNTVPDIKRTLAEINVAGRRALNMEMESSLLFHLAGALGHRAGTVCPTISQPGAPAALVDYNACIEAAISIALEAMLDLCG